MNDPSPSFHSTPVSTPQRNTNSVHHAAVSVRSKRTGTWARPRNSDDGYSRYTSPHS
jgi:syntaxin-binding protein 1